MAYTVHRKPGPHGEAALGAWRGVEGSSERGDAFGHALQSVARDRRTRRVGGAAVLDTDQQLILFIGESHGRAGRARVPCDVRQRLLDDAVRGPVQGRRKQPLPARHHQLHVEAGRAGALDEKRRASRGLVGPQHVQGGAQLAHRLATGLLDREQRGRYLLAALAGQMHGDARLELDDRDAVRERVVQLTGDAQALLPGPAQRGLLPGALRLEGALLGLAQIRLPVLVGEPGDDGAQEPAA